LKSISICGGIRREKKMENIAEKIAEEIEHDFWKGNKLITNRNVTYLHEASSPFSEFFKLGFWAGNEYKQYFYSVGRAYGFVMSGDPFDPTAKAKFTLEKSTISKEEAQKILDTVRKILSKKYNIIDFEYYESERKMDWLQETGRLPDVDD
jgi:hypothetical protein